jgi:hypothetical protein
MGSGSQSLESIQYSELVRSDASTITKEFVKVKFTIGDANNKKIVPCDGVSLEKTVSK